MTQPPLEGAPDATAVTPAADGVRPAVRRYGALTVLTATQSLLGFGISAVAAFYFGAGALKDAWDIAYIIPSVLISMTGFEAFQGVATTVFSRLRAAGDEDPDRVYSTLFVLLGAIAVAVMVAAMLFRGPLVRVVAPGLAPDSAVTAARELGILLGVIPCLALATFLGSTQVAYGYAGSLESCWVVVRVVVILMVIALPASMGITRLSLGFVIGAAVGFAVQLKLMGRTGLHFTKRFDLKSKYLRDAMSQGGLFVIFAIATQACVVVQRELASRGPEGTIAALGYAVSLLGPFYQFVSKPIMVIEGPKIVHLSVTDPAASLRRYDRVVLIGLAVIVPAVIALYFLREPVVRLLFERGRFDAAATARIGEFLAIMSWAVIGDCVVTMSALPAMGQPNARWVPITWSAAAVIQIVFMVAMFPGLGVMVVAWGAVLGAALKAAFAVWFSRRSLAARIRHG
jgi:putative peptidoglycan lipid II flippase